MTTPDSTTDIEEFGIATYGINNNPGVTTTTELPRQEKNIKTLLQPDFSVDVLEEPAAEPISTNGAGWIPLNVDQILGNLPRCGNFSVFYITQILREINLENLKVLKRLFLPFFAVLNFVTLVNFSFQRF